MANVCKIICCLCYFQCFDRNNCINFTYAIKCSERKAKAAEVKKSLKQPSKVILLKNMVRELLKLQISLLLYIHSCKLGGVFVKIHSKFNDLELAWSLQVGPGEVDDDLEGETREECTKYGEVVQVRERVCLSYFLF